MVKILIGSLADAGWVKKDKTAFLEGPDALLQLELQRSQYDSTFFLNVGIWLRSLGAVYFPRYHQCHLQFRLEQLFPDLTEKIAKGTAQDAKKSDIEELRSVILENEPAIRHLGRLSELRQRLAMGGLSGGLVKKEARQVLECDYRP